MNVYAITINDIDKLLLPTIEKLANELSGQVIAREKTKDGTYIEYEFPSYHNQKQFAAALLEIGLNL
ncbi:hypothetical protein ACI6PS_07500 [Flavobacterium sp. PLA-1-15]|uniref:hypothetical protein n=1 Tax=Flavobacterium sp. PLA-1-15 TaxID=3380533 RepID=UPI003B80BD3B